MPNFPVSGATLPDIYDLLCEGKTLQFIFTDDSKLDTFKSALHRYRTNVAKDFESLGEDHEKATNELRFVLSDTIDINEGVAVVVKIVPRERRKYSFTILD